MMSAARLDTARALACLEQSVSNIALVQSLAV